MASDLQSLHIFTLPLEGPPKRSKIAKCPKTDWSLKKREQQWVCWGLTLLSPNPYHSGDDYPRVHVSPEFLCFFFLNEAQPRWPQTCEDNINESTDPHWRIRNEHILLTCQLKPQKQAYLFHAFPHSKSLSWDDLGSMASTSSLVTSIRPQPTAKHHIEAATTKGKRTTTFAWTYHRPLEPSRTYLSRMSTRSINKLYIITTSITSTFNYHNDIERRMMTPMVMGRNNPERRTTQDYKRQINKS